MKVDTAIILCAGFGKRLNPLTLSTPKPLLEINNISILERCIDLTINFGAKKIFLNTFHLGNKIAEFIKIKKFPVDIQIIEDGKEILDTGGGVLNIIKNSKDENFIIFNPDTLWHKDYIDEINRMQDFYFSNRLDNILLLANKKLSFDKNLKGDFKLTKNLLKKSEMNDFIYIGCQILKRNLFDEYQIHSFSILKIWNELLRHGKLNGFESYKKFYHLTNLETFKKLKDL
jgi:MurNAc alpha-1-phosphate uridylyltransferase|tara:strand:- start:1434 stop:2123 length:690 start_codon:yes stop_codon:yes gene_type:complete